MASQESHVSLKRHHDSFNFDDLTDLEQPFLLPPEIAAAYAAQPQEPEIEMDSGESSMPTPPVSVGNNKREASPIRSRSASLSNPASATPSLHGDSPLKFPGLMNSTQPRSVSPSPSAFAALNGNAPPPAKKAKFSFAEREAEKDMKRIQKEIRDQERVAEKARKEQERQAQAEDKTRRDAEKEAEKARKEQERQAQAEDKARRDAEKEAEKKKKVVEREQKRTAQEAERVAKEERKRRKEEAKRTAEEEKRKEAGRQKTLSSFFMTPAATAVRRNSLGDRRSESPAPSNPTLLGTTVACPEASSPKKLEKSVYEKTFPGFYFNPNVTMAPVNRFARDEEASEALHCTIDSYILGNRSPDRQQEFDAVSLFHLSDHDNVLRGKRWMPVREIMAEFSGKSTRPIDLTSDSQNTQIKRTNDYLRSVPLKFLKFQEDVRPPYRGTYTSRPVNGMARLARNPMRRDLPNTNYDYDSEAEWIEDEDAEDLNSEGEEDDELGEDGEDMEGFLDDENDEIANSKRLVLQGDLEPISTGLCWEDQRKRNTNVKMMPYRMEIILDHTMKSIDPFSTQYWQPALPASLTMVPPRLPLNTLKSNSLTVNGSSNSIKRTKPFFTPASEPKTQPTQTQYSTQLQPTGPSATTSNSKPKKLIPQEDMPAFKQEIQGSNLSKVGLIEVLKKKFPGRSGAAIKSTLELIAKRVGAKEADKRWALVENGGT